MITRLLRRVLRRVLEIAFEKVLRRVLRRRLAVGFRGRKGSEKGFLEGGSEKGLSRRRFEKAAETRRSRVRPRWRVPYRNFRHRGRDSRKVPESEPFAIGPVQFS